MISTNNSWEQRKFDEVVSRIGTGLNPRDNFVLNNGGKNYYVTIKNFEHGHLYLDDDCDKVDDEALKLIQARSDLKVSDILFTSIGRIGDCYLIAKQPQNWNINESVFTLRPNQNEVEPEYLFHVIHSEKVLNQILNDVTGSTFKSIKIGDLKKTDISKPSKNEQLKIARFVTKLEDIIALHQREQIYKINGVKTKITLFIYSWEQRNFSKLAETRRGLTYSPVNIKDEGIRVLRSSNIDEEYFIKSEDDVFVEKECINIPYIKNGDILITSANGSSRLVGKHAIVDGLPSNSAVHGGFMLLASSENPYFTNASMSSPWYKKFIDLYVAGGNGAIGNLNKNDLDNYDVAVPENDEQIKIGNLFKNIDSLITLHQREQSP